MDGSASKGDSEINNLLGLYLNIDNLSYPSHMNQNKSVIKYTRIPDFDEQSRVSWPQKSNSLEPRLRRIVMIEEPRLETNRSLKSQVALPSRKMSSDICKRQVIPIEEDSYSLHPKFSQNVKKPHHKMINRAIETETKEEKQSSQKKLSKLNYSSRSYKRSSRTTVTSNNDKKEVIVSKLGHKYNTYTKGDNETRSYDKSTKSNEIARSGRNANVPSKLNTKKRLQTTEKEVEKEHSSIKNKVKEIRKTSQKRTVSEKTKSTKSTVKYNHNKVIDFDGVQGLHQPVSVIHVPLDVKPKKHDRATAMSPDILNINDKNLSFVDSSVQVINNTNLKDVMVETELWPGKVDQITEIDENFLYDKSYDNVVKKSFDSLDIPNVSLMNKRSDLPKEEVVDIVNTDNYISETSPINTCKRNEEKVIESHYHKNTSYIISRATLTYTTRQKIDFHVVGNNEVLQSHLSSEPCNYPLKVVSVFKQEMKKQENKDRKKHYVKKDVDKRSIVKRTKDLTPVNCSYVFDNHKLIKPSDIISTIKVDSSLFHRNYICEQFQRELNFIDSFFESLQYLENSSLNENSITDKKVENFINSGRDLSNIEFGSFLSKVEDEVTQQDIDDTDTIASKNLCLLNLLIRDEQKRAKRILIVLKMREDALKDFTKSQILWLENKKKQDNIDISTLKKKQRGALLKLQQECGEMQRMRKALLAVLEKRKLALMKTKKNIELKLRSSLDLEQIILGKKKLRRSISADRQVAPVKCFELSSSGCDDSTTSRPKSAPTLLQNESKSITSAEKCVQTGDSITTTRQIDQSTNTTDENFVVVDGGYLNILFHNLSLPQIFSGGKQYEVNQEALKNIVQTSNTHHFTNNDVMIEELMEQIKDLDRSSTPSTARSLVEEFDQIYKGLAEEEKLKHNSERNCDSVIEDIKDCAIELNHVEEDSDKSRECDMMEYVEDIVSDDPRVDVSCTCELPVVSVGASNNKGCGGSREVIGNVSGPLPVPAGAAAAGDDADVSSWLNQSSQDDSGSSSGSNGSSSGSGGSSQAFCPTVSPLTTPVQFEAQELRRQQLEIEREIKALEQQQCQLLALREIPDKPPPPYTPPAEPKSKIPRNFTVDKIAEQIIKDVITETNSDFSLTDPFDVFVGDYCEEAVEKQKLEKNEKYWDTCNFLPSKTPLNTEKFIQKTVTDLKDVLTSVQPAVVSGVGARRSDHIDDILFAEWRRCEPEWTSLHADDVIVKNQVFESIFQKILTETIDEYKKTVVTPKKCNNE